MMTRRHALSLAAWWFLALATSPCLAQGADADPADSQQYMEEGAFSLTPPQGWEVSEVPGYTYKFIFAPTEDEFRPHMLIEEEDYDGGLDEYVDASEKTLLEVFEGVEVVSRSDVATGSGTRSVRLVTNDVHNDPKLRQVYYFFEGEGKIFMITCTRLQSQPESLDAEFEASAKTFVPALSK